MGFHQAQSWDAVIVGAGAAGLFCAAQAGLRGKRILLLDHARVIGEKIRISGGGFCNFTNRYSAAQHFLSLNPHFVKGPLARYRPSDFEAWLQKKEIPYHEKHRGQLFCDRSAKDIIQLLLDQCVEAGVALHYPVRVEQCHFKDTLWHIHTSMGLITAQQLVWATGGLPVPKIGASDIALHFAKEWGQTVVNPRPALVPLTLTSNEDRLFTELSGLSVPVHIEAGVNKQHYGRAEFDEDLLLTHRGLSGPAVLQASSYWREGEKITVAFITPSQWQQLQQEAAGKTVDNLLATLLPLRLASTLSELCGLTGRRYADLKRVERDALEALLLNYNFQPQATLGWNKAEVMLGGVDVREMDSRTMASNRIPHCYFIGECVDVTGHLGGHNFQWAWSSAYVCAQAL